MSHTVVSACLLGRPCRYDGGEKAHPPTQQWVARQRAQGWDIVTVCPEELGGLGTPRLPAELRGGGGRAVLEGQAQVVNIQGQNITEAFVRGAVTAAKEATGAQQAILKARSPSCGCGQTQIDGSLAEGDGVFAALLRSKGLHIMTEEQLGET